MCEYVNIYFSHINNNNSNHNIARTKTDINTDCVFMTDVLLSVPVFILKPISGKCSVILSILPSVFLLILLVLKNSLCHISTIIPQTYSLGGSKKSHLNTLYMCLMSF
jgi:hypothetical protein